MQEPGKKAKIKTRYFKLRIDKATLAVLLLFIIVYLSWLFSFPQFGPIMSNFFNGFKSLSIEKGKWVMLFFASMILSSLGSGFLIDKVSKRTIFIGISTIVASILTFSFIWLDIETGYLFSVFLGIAAGISPVAWGAYFADHALPEDRGRIMGIGLGVALPIAQLFLLTNTFATAITVNVQMIIIGALLLVTFAAFAFRPKEITQDAVVRPRKGPPARQILLYAIPVFLFYLVGGILFAIVFPTIQGNVGENVFYLIWAIPFVIAAIIAGIQLDLRGRKFPTMVGLAITGVCLAIFGIMGVTLGYIVMIPLAVGYAFVATTSLIIWADLAPAKSRGKFYGLGFGLMALAQMIGLILTGTFFGNASTSQINAYMLFSSIALFLCIPPLILAEEALPKELVEKRQLLDYLDGVKNRFGKKKQE